MAVINTNISSINAQNNLARTQGELQTSLQRLSSGLRINSAKDDAAGLAISNRFTSQIRGLNQAARNANDGISIAQVAEGALQESTNILQRMRELALQSANGSNSADDRAALQAEVTQLQSELTRIAETTSFGTLKILDGTFGTADFQIGAQANQTVSLTLADASADVLGITSGKEVAETGYDQDNTGIAAETLTFTVVNGGVTTAVDVSLAEGIGTQDLVDAINNEVGAYGILAINNSGSLDLAASNDVTSVTIQSSVAADAGVFATNAGATAITPGAADGKATGTAVGSISVATASNAQAALANIDAAITTIDGQRADLGAFQNRLESTISNLRNISENVSAARSRILDADFAAETANLTRIQILQQAGTSILAQANAAPQSVLSLLQ